MQTSATLTLKRGETLTFKITGKDLCIYTSDKIELGHFRQTLDLFQRFLEESNGVRYLEDKAGPRLVMMTKTNSITFRTDHTIWTADKSKVKEILANMKRPYGEVRKENI